MRHLDVEQARALRAKYPAWSRWTALEKGDWVDHPVFNRPALVDRRTPKGRIVLTTSSGHYPPADCLLLPTVGDLLDLAETLGRVDTSGPWTDEQYKGIEYQAELYLHEGPIHGRHVSEAANTPLDALYAALMGGE